MVPVGGEGPSGPTTLASTLAARLREAILAGDLSPGCKLRLDELRVHYGVSLSPLREALSRLSIEGLVHSEDQKGYRVAPVSLHDLEEVTCLRVELESMALRRAIELGDDEWEAGLIAAFHRLHKLEGARGDLHAIGDWELAHRVFHTTLIVASRMPLLLGMCNTLHNLGDRYRRMRLGQIPFDRDAPGEHRAIFEATLARDQLKACALLQEHIQRTAKAAAIVLHRLVGGAIPEDAAYRQEVGAAASIPGKGNKTRGGSSFA